VNDQETEKSALCSKVGASPQNGSKEVEKKSTVVMQKTVTVQSVGRIIHRRY
jgi:hypothetical protein